MPLEFGDECEGMELKVRRYNKQVLMYERFVEMNRKEKESAALMGTNVDGLSDMVVKQ